MTYRYNWGHLHRTGQERDCLPIGEVPHQWIRACWGAVDIIRYLLMAAPSFCAYWQNTDWESGSQIILFCQGVWHQYHQLPRSPVMAMTLFVACNIPDLKLFDNKIANNLIANKSFHLFRASFSHQANIKQLPNTDIFYVHFPRNYFSFKMFYK